MLQLLRWFPVKATSAMSFYGRVRAPSLGAVLTYVYKHHFMGVAAPHKTLFYTVELLILTYALCSSSLPILKQKSPVLLRYNTKPVSWNLVSGQTSALHPQEEDQEL